MVKKAGESTNDPIKTIRTEFRTSGLESLNV